MVNGIDELRDAMSDQGDVYGDGRMFNKSLWGVLVGVFIVGCVSTRAEMVSPPIGNNVLIVPIDDNLLLGNTVDVAIGDIHIVGLGVDLVSGDDESFLRGSALRFELTSTGGASRSLSSVWFRDSGSLVGIAGESRGEAIVDYSVLLPTNWAVSGASLEIDADAVGDAFVEYSFGLARIYEGVPPSNVERTVLSAWVDGLYDDSTEDTTILGSWPGVDVAHWLVLESYESDSSVEVVKLNHNLNLVAVPELNASLLVCSGLVVGSCWRLRRRHVQKSRKPDGAASSLLG